MGIVARIIDIGNAGSGLPPKTMRNIVIVSPNSIANNVDTIELKSFSRVDTPIKRE